MRLTAFNPEELDRIHGASLEILSRTGVVFHSSDALNLFKKHGARVENDRVFIPETLVDDALSRTPKEFEWQARNPEHTIVIGRDALGVQPNIGPIYIHDMKNGRRHSVLKDFVNMQKLAQTSDVVNLVGSLPVEPSDLPQDTKHLQMLYEVLKHTDKPVIGMAGHRKEATEALEMMALAVRPYTDHPFSDNHWICVAVNPLSPLSFSPDAIETLFAYAGQNQPIFIPPAIMAGVTGPINPLGTVILQNTEILAGLALVQLINPGTPVVYTCASTAAYMKTAAFITGPPELPLIHAGGIQMGREYYGLPTRSLSGMSDAKTPDCQAGLESMASGLTSVLSGAHILVEAMGCLESFMTTSYEKFIIDEEIISRALYMRQGMDASKSAVAREKDLIVEVGRGDYLTHMNTLQNFRSCWQPRISDWGGSNSGENDSLLERAANQVEERLAQAPQSLISGEEERHLKEYMESC